MTERCARTDGLFIQMTMNTLILGRNGQLGWTLEHALAGRVPLTALGRDALDLHDTVQLARTVQALRPQVVFNAAAYTAVDRAESEPDAAYAVNARAPEALAKVCAQIGALLIHYSTDYVFDGQKAGRWVESDPTGPLSVYGASKRAGEEAILATGAAAVILRTSWVYGDHGGNFAKTMLRVATERDALRVVADQHGTPTWTGRLSEVSRAIVDQAAASGDALGWLGTRRGIYHAAASGATTWADYARCVLEVAAAEPAFASRLRVKAPQVESIPSSAYPTPARRPLNSLLDCSRLAQTFDLTLPDWRVDVEAFVKRYVATV